MDDCDIISEGGHSVQEVEKSYSVMHLSEEHGTATGSVSRSPSATGDLRSTESHPISATAISGLAAMEASVLEKSEDRNLSGASCEPSIPLQDGAGEAGGANVMSKMMMVMMMAGGENHTVPGTSAMPEFSAPDIVSMLKSGEMPPLSDMMSMMVGGGGLPAMKTGGMNGGVGPMGMAKIFDCIINMSLAKADLDVSDDKDNGSADELPCQYCCRSFCSHMTLKTHILVAHDQDDSVLNLTQLTISKRGKSLKDGPQRSRKHSEDVEVFASGASVKGSSQNSASESMSTPTDLAAAEFVSVVRGLKRGRTESKDLETVEEGGASGVEDQTREEDPQISSSPHDLGAFSETSSDSSLCLSGLGSQSDTPMDVASGSRSRPKKTKTKRISRHNPRAAGGGEDSVIISKLCAPTSVGSADGSKTSQARNKGQWSADQPSLDRARTTQGPQGTTAAGASEQAAGESPTSARRSLQSRK